MSRTRSSWLSNKGFSSNYRRMRNMKDFKDRSKTSPRWVRMLFLSLSRPSIEVWCSSLLCRSIRLTPIMEIRPKVDTTFSAMISLSWKVLQSFSMTMEAVLPHISNLTTSSIDLKRTSKQLSSEASIGTCPKMSITLSSWKTRGFRMMQTTRWSKSTASKTPD